MPINRFSTMSMRPTPCFRARALAARKSSSDLVVVPELVTSLVGMPAVKVIVKSSGSDGADLGSLVSFHMSSGGVVSGSSKIPAS